MDKNKLIIENKRRIEAIANKLKTEYSLNDDMVMDLVSDGFVSLLEQAKCYDETLGVSLWSYARNGTYGAMLQSIQRMITTYDIPEHLNRQFTQIGRIKNQYSDIPDSELADMASAKLNVSKNKANELISMYSRTRSDSDEISKDSIAEDNDDDLLFAADKLTLEHIRTLLDTVIKPRHAEYIRLRYGIDRKQMSCAEIAEQFCVTESAVRKGLGVAIMQIKKGLKIIS